MEKSKTFSGDRNRAITEGEESHFSVCFENHPAMGMSYFYRICGEEAPEIHNSKIVKEENESWKF